MFNIFKKKQVSIDTVDDRLKHIAFIMDGNGRWAKKRGMPREYGHSVGAKTFRNIVEYCIDKGVKTVTVYAFSTENWSRPENEVNAIMKLLKDYLVDALTNFTKRNLKIVFIGDKTKLDNELIELINKLEYETKDYEYVLNIALNYGSHNEIVNAVNTLISEGKTCVTAEDISSHLYTSHCTFPDLIVRTAGELRLSNFLLWQAAYSEFYFTDVLWPDLEPKHIDEIINEFYTKRDRRYGGVKQ